MMAFRVLYVPTAFGVHYKSKDGYYVWRSDIFGDQLGKYCLILWQFYAKIRRKVIPRYKKNPKRSFFRYGRGYVQFYLFNIRDARKKVARLGAPPLKRRRKFFYKYSFGKIRSQGLRIFFESKHQYFDRIPDFRVRPMARTDAPRYKVYVPFSRTRSYETSPHLFLYKSQFTSMFSICMRISGFVLFFWSLIYIFHLNEISYCSSLFSNFYEYLYSYRYYFQDMLRTMLVLFVLYHGVFGLKYFGNINPMKTQHMLNNKTMFNSRLRLPVFYGTGFTLIYIMAYMFSFINIII